MSKRLTGKTVALPVLRTGRGGMARPGMTVEGPPLFANRGGWMLRALLRSPKGRAVVAVLICYALWQLWLMLAAPGKIAAGFPGDGERVDILVTLPFPPERFHV